MSEAHATTIEVDAPVPSAVAVGAAIALKVKVSCAAGCDLRGMPVNIVAPDGVPVTHELAIHVAGISETGDITLRAPPRIGEHVWSISFPPHERAGILHEQSTLTIAVRTNPLASSLAVWDIPSPVVMGDRFTIKVGAKSAGACKLAGSAIAVCDETGAKVAGGRLQETPLPGTSALYWTQVELVAPAAAGMVSWSVKFEAAEQELPHHGASSSFSVAVVKPPEHRLTVKVIEKDTTAAIEDAHIRLGAYGAATDQAGRAELEMPSGIYDLHVWKVGYETPPMTVEIKADATLQVEIIKVPEEDPDAAWTM